MSHTSQGTGKAPKTATGMTHTPGPWTTGARMTRVEAHPKGWRVPMCIADCHPEGYPPDTEEECVANARLIAAAPAMLKLLHDAITQLDFGGEPRTAIGHAIRAFQQQAGKVIAHAEGRG